MSPAAAVTHDHQDLNETVPEGAVGGDVIEADAVVIGAGPVGLFQVFELGLLEIKAHVIDSLAYPGGQRRGQYVETFHWKEGRWQSTGPGSLFDRVGP